MKRPENFRKVHMMYFTTKTGNKYKFSVDGVGPWPIDDTETVLWAFTDPNTSKYCLAFIIDWKTETYQIKRAENGEGANWVDTLHSGNYTSQPMKTINSFIDWAHNRVIQFEHNYNKL